MSEEVIRLGDQSGTTPERGRSDAAVALLKADVARLVTGLDLLISELSGIKEKLNRIEKTLSEIAVGLGVQPS